MTKKSLQTFKYLENKKSFHHEIFDYFSRFFIIFKEVSVARNCLRPNSWHLKRTPPQAHVKKVTVKEVLTQD